MFFTKILSFVHFLPIYITKKKERDIALVLDLPVGSNNLIMCVDIKSRVSFFGGDFVV